MFISEASVVFLNDASSEALLYCDEIYVCRIEYNKIEAVAVIMAIITAKVIPDYDKIEELHDIDDDDEDKIYDLIWNKIKEVNKQLTSYKAVKALEIKEGEFEKTSTMKIKRYKEINKDKEKNKK